MSRENDFQKLLLKIMGHIISCLPKGQGDLAAQWQDAWSELQKTGLYDKLSRPVLLNNLALVGLTGKQLELKEKVFDLVKDSGEKLKDFIDLILGSLQAASGGSLLIDALKELIGMFWIIRDSTKA